MQASQPTFLTQGLDRSPSPPLAQHSGSREATYDSPKAPNGGNDLTAPIENDIESILCTPPSSKRPKTQHLKSGILEAKVRRVPSFHTSANDSPAIFKVPATKRGGALNRTYGGTPTVSSSKLHPAKHSRSVMEPLYGVHPTKQYFGKRNSPKKGILKPSLHTSHGSRSLPSCAADNTFLHGELPSGLLPAARSSALHASYSLNSFSYSDISNTTIRTVRPASLTEKSNQTGCKPARNSHAALAKPPPKVLALSNYSSVSNSNDFQKKLGVGPRSSMSIASSAESGTAVNDNPVEMEGDSELHKTIVSMIWQKGMLGACVYNTDTLKLQLLQDIPEGEGFLSASQLLMQTQADIVITGAKQDSRFVQALTDMVAARQAEHCACHLYTLASEDLGYEISKRRLYMACENSLAKGCIDKEAYISSTVDVSHVNMVRAAGGLLRYIEANLVNSMAHLQNSKDEDMPVISVELYNMQSQVWMDAHTLSSLRIIHIADHPSTCLGNFYKRDGFSLFGLMDRCKTSIGKKKLKELFLTPTRDIRLLNERLDCLQYFSPDKNTEVTRLIKSNLSRLRNMSRIVCKMRTAELSSGDWLAMHRVLQSLIAITEICSQRKDELLIFSKFPPLREGILSCGQILFDILDVEQTKLTKTFTIKPNYDAEMDALVQRHRDLPQLLADRLAAHVKEVKHVARSAVHIHYSSQLGCLLMIDITPHMERTADYNIEELTLEFLTERNAYYSSALTRDISELHGDVKTAITDRALALMYQLQNTLLPEMNTMLQVLELCSQLDCLIGLGSYCSERNFVRPTLNEEDTIRITGARHALLEAQADHFISNDVHSGPGNDNSKVMIITGPNACGKSIYLKQAIIIVYLAHIGCLVPAESADICLIDAIYTHFPTTDSINADVSTFTADLSRMAAIVSNATRSSLVVLDEFGKGTCPVDGVSLLLAFLKHWIDSGAGSCPHVLLATHFHSIVKSSWIKQSPLTSLKMMETHLEDGKLVYLYELVDGAAEISHAAAVAQILEISQDCLVRGAQATDEYKVSRQIAIANKNKLMQSKKSIVEHMLNLDLEEMDAVSTFFNTKLNEQ